MTRATRAARATTVILLACCLALLLPGGCGGTARQEATSPSSREPDGVAGDLSGSDSRALSEPELPRPGYLEPFEDPVFGTTVERVTDARSMGLDFIVNDYSRMNPWNSDGTLMVLRDSESQWLVLDAETYEVLHRVKTGDGENLVSAIDPRWDPDDPDAFYYVDENSLMRWSCSRRRGSVVHTWKEYGAVNLTGEGNLSRDGNIVALAGLGGDDGTPQDVFVYYMGEDRVGPKKSLGEAPAGIDWVSVTPNGDYVMVLWGDVGKEPYLGGELFDLDWNLVGRVTGGCHHGDFALEKDGSQAFVMCGANDPDFPDTSYIIKYSIPSCRATPILETDWYFGTHVSGRCLDRPGWVVVSTFHEWSEEGGGPEHGDPEGDWDPFENEIFALAIDGSGEVRRICHDHAEKQAYFEEPHAAANADLTRVAFSSNWGIDMGEENVDVYVADVPWP
ncbi:MAG: hypothetical protein V1748_00505 [Actinomycetota bacterium]